MRGARGAMLLEALVALAIAAVATAAWMPLRQAAGATLDEARARAAAADAVRAVHEQAQAGVAAPVGSAESAGRALRTEWRAWPDLPSVVDMVHVASHAGRDGLTRRWAVAARVFAPPASNWAGLAEASTTGPALLGPAGRPPGWPMPPDAGDEPPPTAVSGPAAPRMPSSSAGIGITPVHGRRGACAAHGLPGAADAAVASDTGGDLRGRAVSPPAPEPPVRSPPSCGDTVPAPPPWPPPSHRTLLSGSLHLDPVLVTSPSSAAAVQAWMVGIEPPATGAVGCSLASIDDPGVRLAWWCLVDRGVAGDAPDAWVDRALGPLAGALPAAMRLCRHVDAPPPSGATRPGEAMRPSPDPRAASWRVHLRLVPAAAGCPDDLRPVAGR